MKLGSSPTPEPTSKPAEDEKTYMIISIVFMVPFAALSMLAVMMLCTRKEPSKKGGYNRASESDRVEMFAEQ